MLGQLFRQSLRELWQIWMHHVALNFLLFTTIPFYRVVCILCRVCVCVQRSRSVLPLPVITSYQEPQKLWSKGHYMGTRYPSPILLSFSLSVPPSPFSFENMSDGWCVAYIQRHIRQGRSARVPAPDEWRQRGPCHSGGGRRGFIKWLATTT